MALLLRAIYIYYFETMLYFLNVYNIGRFHLKLIHNIQYDLYLNIMSTHLSGNDC